MGAIVICLWVVLLLVLRPIHPKWFAALALVAYLPILRVNRKDWDVGVFCVASVCTGASFLVGYAVLSWVLGSAAAILVLGGLCAPLIVALMSLLIS